MCVGSYIDLGICWSQIEMQSQEIMFLRIAPGRYTTEEQVLEAKDYFQSQLTPTIKQSSKGYVTKPKLKLLALKFDPIDYVLRLKVQEV